MEHTPIMILLEIQRDGQDNERKECATCPDAHLPQRCEVAAVVGTWVGRAVCGELNVMNTFKGSLLLGAKLCTQITAGTNETTNHVVGGVCAHE